ncbi:MAG: hypothetical protein KDB79_02725, partial [Acidobacteria bacterium]|nr:hypothetical protein [Acidobacteriota bacterium]
MSMRSWDFSVNIMARALILAAVGIIFCSSTFAQKDSFKVVNIMDDFWTFWEKAENAEPGVQIELFRNIVIKPHNEIFLGFTGDQSDEDLGEYLKLVPKLIPRLKKVTAQLKTDLEKNKAVFLKNFPGMKWKGEVVFMPNFGVTDSGTGTLGGKQYLIFGVDTVAAQYGENADFSVLAHHELFHLYLSELHSEWKDKNRSDGEVPLYWLVWNEGLATYVSHKLNPDATPEQIFISKTLQHDAEEKLRVLASGIRRNLINGSVDIWTPYMSNEKNDKGIPPRSGYYVGYLIAKELNKEMPLEKLAQLKGKDLIRKMDRILRKFEKYEP